MSCVLREREVLTELVRVSQAKAWSSSEVVGLKIQLARELCSLKVMASKTRASSELYGLGPAVSADDLHLPRTKLPTLRMILRAMKYLSSSTTESGSQSHYQIAKMLYPQIEEIYGRAGVPLQPIGSKPANKEKVVCIVISLLDFPIFFPFSV